MDHHDLYSCQRIEQIVIELVGARIKYIQESNIESVPRNCFQSVNFDTRPLIRASWLDMDVIKLHYSIVASNMVWMVRNTPVIKGDNGSYFDVLLLLLLKISLNVFLYDISWPNDRAILIPWIINYFVSFEAHVLCCIFHLQCPLLSKAIISSVAQHQNVEIAMFFQCLYCWSEEPKDSQMMRSKFELTCIRRLDAR